MKILVTGGSGYKGSILIPKLLDDGHEIVCVDTFWFGDYLKDHPCLLKIKTDIRDIDNIPLDGVETIIHLANIANDPAVELNPTLSWETNVLASHQLADKAVRYGVKQIIYASSGSVYGVKKELKVTEDLKLVPISVYNKTKMVAERVFLSFKEKMDIKTIHGLASYPSIQKLADAENSDMVIAVTGSDEVNMAACHIAKSLFNVPKRIARLRANEYLRDEDNFNKSFFSISEVISPNILLTDYVKNILDHPGAFQAFQFASGLVQVLAATVLPDGPLSGKKLSEFN